MGIRRRARIAAVQILYIFDATKGEIYEIWEKECERTGLPPDGREFSRSLIDKAYKNLEEIDKTIKDHLINWSFDRLAAVDRAILRMGVTEFLYFPDIPPKVTIDECVEIAKKYSTEKSPSFVNGVLDTIAKGLGLL